MRIGILIELSELSYSHGLFKRFLEKINLLYSQVDTFSTESLIDKVREHIRLNFEYENVKQTLLESGVSNALIYVQPNML